MRALLLWSTVACVPSGPVPEDMQPWSKIRFDISALNQDGLLGPVGGLRSIAYEFCIPARPALADEVRAIDPSAEVFAASPGRVSCAGDQYLVIGNTHQTAFRQVLVALARLEYVTEIRQSDFE